MNLRVLCLRTNTREPKDISVGAPGPVRLQLEEVGRPGGGRLHRTDLSTGEEGTDPSSTREAGRGRQRGQETWAGPRVSAHSRI